MRLIESHQGFRLRRELRVGRSQPRLHAAGYSFYAYLVVGTRAKYILQGPNQNHEPADLKQVFSTIAVPAVALRMISMQNEPNTNADAA